MSRRIHKHIKRIFAFFPAVKPEKTQEREGQFPLNISNSDRISFKFEINLKGKTVKICNVSYEIKIDEIWILVIRYDDHGGGNEFHRHEVISITNDSDTPITIGVRQKGTKKTLTQWAINDIRKNYLIYRQKFLKRSKLKIY